MEQISPKYLIIINTCDLPCHSAIMKLCNRRAAGPNNIPPLLLKCAISPVSQALRLLFTQVWHSGRVPAEWQGRILSLYKGNGSMSHCSNYRPISLLSCPGSLHTYSSFACNSLLDQIKRPPTVKIYGREVTIDAILTLRLLAELHQSYRQPLNVEYVNIKSCLRLC